MTDALFAALERGVRWWLQGLAHALPERFRSAGRALPAHLLAVIRGAVVELQMRDATGPASEAVRFDLAADGQSAAAQEWIARRVPEDAPVIARFPKEDSLSKLIKLPLAAEADLRQVLAYEMDRQTPFSAAHVYFDCRVVERDRPGNRLHVALAALPRRVVDGALESLRGIGLRPRVVDTDEHPYPAAGINLLPQSPEPETASSGFRLRFALYVLLACLVFAVAWVPVIETSESIEDLRREAADASARTQEVARLRQAYDDLLADAMFFRDQDAARARVIDVLAELTRLLPDDSWVFGLEVNDRNAQIRGESANASELLSLIEDSPMLEAVQFASPITRNNANGTDRFQISAVLSPRPGP